MDNHQFKNFKIAKSTNSWAMFNRKLLVYHDGIFLWWLMGWGSGGKPIADRWMVLVNGTIPMDWFMGKIAGNIRF